jgi:serine phosphatase RsbU (regulator of sigma subunit)
VVHDTRNDGRQGLAGTRLASVLLDATAKRGQAVLWTAVGAALEIAIMVLLGFLGAARVLGLPGPLAVAIAGFVGIVCGIEASVVVSLAAAVAYGGFLGHFGHTIHPAVIAASGVLWVVMSALIARGGGSLRRQIIARLQAQTYTEALYRDLEQSLLPTTAVTHPRLGVASLYVPGERGMRLAGDFFDVATLGDGSLALVIGDVSGHGPRAAALGAMLRGAWRGVVTEASPAATAHTLHRIALAEGAPSDTFATALFAWIDAECTTLRLISAGHPAPLLITTEVTEVTVDHLLPLGVSESTPRWHVTTVALPADWTLFFYTDGMTDMRERQGMTKRLGLDGLTTRLAAIDRSLTEAALQGLFTGIATDSGEAPPDDVAAVAVTMMAAPSANDSETSLAVAGPAEISAATPAEAVLPHRQ